jgi:hypothetical protein
MQAKKMEIEMEKITKYVFECPRKPLPPYPAATRFAPGLVPHGIALGGGGRATPKSRNLSRKLRAATL